MIHFETCARKVNGEIQTKFDENTGSAVVVKWEVCGSPTKVDGKFFVFTSAERVVIPSNLAAIANNSVNAVATKVGKFIGKSSTTVVDEASNNRISSSIEVHTGYQVIMSRDVILKLFKHTELEGLTLETEVILNSGDEVVMKFTNNTLKDIIIESGKPIAFGVIQRVEPLD